MPGGVGRAVRNGRPYPIYATLGTQQIRCIIPLTSNAKHFPFVSDRLYKPLIVQFVNRTFPHSPRSGIFGFNEISVVHLN
jgi:hypothetical protein